LKIDGGEKARVRQKPKAVRLLVAFAWSELMGCSVRVTLVAEAGAI